MMNAIPQLDLGDFLAAPRSRAAARFISRLLEACHGPGFCYLAGHGVPTELDRAVMAAAREFFALPEHARRALGIARSPHFRGYTVLGDERTKGARDWREQLDVGAEEEPVRVSPSDPPWLRLRGPNQWPAELPGLESVVLEWMRAMDRVGLAVLRALAVGLGQPMDYFDPLMLPRGDPHLKIIRYPAQCGNAGTGQGVGMHQDSGVLSFVLQDDVGGLQVQSGDGLIDAVPEPGTYVMNLGEMVQAATSGYLCATRHRVLSPPPGKARVSIAYFFHPRLEAVFEPIPLPAKLAQAAPGGQNADPADPVLACFGENYLKIRLRSHPDVANAHYQDVLEGLPGA